MSNKTCKNCQYGIYDEMQGHVCVNDDSEQAADFVEPDHSCDDYVQKENGEND